jgi:hypothetical protein
MTKLINNVRRKISTAGDDGPPSNKIPAMAWEVKEKILKYSKSC